MEARNSAGAISAISFANKNAGRSNCVNHQPAEKHGKKERSVQQSSDWRSQNEACFCSLFYFFPLSLSLSVSLCFWKIAFQEGWQSARKSGCFTLNYLRTQLPVCLSFWSFDRRAAWTRSFWQRGIGGSSSNSEVEIIRVSLRGQRVL